MCGIAGKIVWNGPTDEVVVRRMCDHMVHRGPDDAGVMPIGPAVLGHRRLSIIDLSANGHQPMSSLDGRFHIVYNGEVYNFKSIRQELKDLGVAFKSDTDTEVVLYAYIHWGANCLTKFNGMFALAIWDKQKRELFLARDRFGKKPLFYYLASNMVSFASELSALMQDADISQEISYEALNCYLAIGYILAPMTFYKNVLKLEPASYLIISQEGQKIKKERYWDYAAGFRVKTKESEEEITHQLISRLKTAVERRMVSDVPLGAFLSGGIDSSSVACLAKQFHQGPMHTFSIGFEQKSYNELDDAKRAADFIGTLHHNKVCIPVNGLQGLERAIDAYDEPFADNSCIPTLELSDFTASTLKVALSGDGADEIFAGYITYKADKYYRYAQFIPKNIRRLLVDFLKRNEKLARSQHKIGLRYKAKQFFYGTLFSPEKAHYAWRLMFDPSERVAILGEKYKTLIEETDPFLIFKKHYDAVTDLDWLDRHLYVDAMTWLTDDILVKVDRASMHHSIEVRCPYLDVDLATYAASIPSNLKLKGMTTKYILKRSLRSILPEVIIHKKKERL